MKNKMKKNGMQWLGISLLVITLVAVALTLLVVVRLTSPASAKEETTIEESFSGTLYNAYLYNNEENKLILFYEGKNYVAYETARDNYTGVADIEIENGKITKIYSKSDTIEGKLVSYSNKKIQISGYEPLAYDQRLPVYVLAGTQFGKNPVRQKALSDLVIGNSKVKLVVANHKACAIIQSGDDAMEHIRVLIKNKSQIEYPNLYVKSMHAYKAGGRSIAAKKTVDAKTLLKGKKNGEEVQVEPTEGMLYLCDENGKIKGSGYEGIFLLRKEKSGYILINELTVEDYVRYVLPSEMPVTFSYEALKAQAVCARTFAYKQMKSQEYAQYGANLDDTTSYQVYHKAKTYEITDQAVHDTQGMVLTYDDKLIQCYYYSTSAGYSENLEVWNTDSPHYLVAENHTEQKKVDLSKKKQFHKFISKKVPSKDDHSPYYRWKAELSSKMAMDAKYGRLKKLEIKKRSKSGYVLSLRAKFEEGERIYDKENEIRFFLGEYLTRVTLSDKSVKTGLSSVPSACFEIVSQKDGKIVLQGGGFGHDIGMSQYGADAMGCQGKNWQEILNTYYKDAEISCIFDVDME